MALTAYSYYLNGRTSPGTQVVSGLGFRPTVVLFISRWISNSPHGESDGGRFLIGAADGTRQWVAHATSEKSLYPYARHFFDTSCCIYVHTEGYSPIAQASLVSLDADGFTLNWTTGMQSGDVYYIAFDATDAYVGTLDLAAATGNQAITGLGFEPSVLFFANSIANTTQGLATHSALSFGVATSPTERFAYALSGKNGGTVSVEKSIYYDNRCIVRLSETGTLQAAADLTSLDSDGFTLNVATAPAQAMRVGYLALGGVQAKIFTVDTPDPSTSETNIPLPFQAQALIGANIYDASHPGVLQSSGRFAMSLVAQNAWDWPSAVTLGVYNLEGQSNPIIVDSGYTYLGLASFTAPWTTTATTADVLLDTGEQVNLTWYNIDSDAPRFSYVALAGGSTGTPGAEDFTSGTLDLLPTMAGYMVVNGTVSDTGCVFSADLTLTLPTLAGAIDPPLAVPAPTLAGQLLTGTLARANLTLTAPDLAAQMKAGAVLSADLSWPLATLSASLGLDASQGAALLQPMPTLAGAYLSGERWDADITLAAGTLTGDLLAGNSLTLAEDLRLPTLAGALGRDPVAFLAQTLALPTLSGAFHTDVVLSASLTLPLVPLAGTLDIPTIWSATLAAPALLEVVATWGDPAPAAASGEALVFNTRSQGLTRYTGFGFNSFVRIKGQVFAASSTGIYVLGGETDAGAPIGATVRLPLSDFNDPHLKRIDRAYLGYRTNGELVLRIAADENDWYEYPLERRGNDAGLHGVRVKLGKGFKGRYLQAELANLDGADFDCDAIALAPSGLSRKVG